MELLIVVVLLVLFFFVLFFAIQVIAQEDKVRLASKELEEASHICIQCNKTYGRAARRDGCPACGNEVVPNGEIARELAVRNNGRPVVRESMKPRTFCPEIDEKQLGRFSNLIRAFDENDAEAYERWHGEILKSSLDKFLDSDDEFDDDGYERALHEFDEEREDAVKCVVHVFEGVRAAFVVEHALPVLEVSSEVKKRVEQGELSKEAGAVASIFSNKAFDAVREAVDSAEAMLSYDVLPSIVFHKKFNESAKPQNRFRRIITLLENEARGIATEADSQEFQHLMDTRKILTGLSLGSLRAKSTSAKESLGTNSFPDLAYSMMAIAFSSVRHEEDRALERRCQAIAKRCAEKVPPGHPEFSNMRSSFKDAQIELPEYKKSPVNGPKVLVDVSGALCVVDQKTLSSEPEGEAKMNEKAQASNNSPHVADEKKLPVVTHQNQAPMKIYSEQRDESGRVPFANAFKAFYTNNGSAFCYWVDQVLSRPIDDAYTHAALQYRFAWARNALLHYAVCIEFGLTVSNEIMSEIEGGLSAIEWLLSYELLAPVQKVTVDNRYRHPSDPTSSVTYEVQEFRKHRYASFTPEYAEEVRQRIATALLNGRNETLLNWTMPALLCDPGAEKEVELLFAELAGKLAIFSSMLTTQAPVLSQRLAETAKRCASKASTTEVDYPNMIKSFKNAGLSVPPASPQERVSNGWRVSLEGDLVPNVPGAALQQITAAGPSSEGELLRGIEKSLLGLVGLDGFKPLLAMDVFEFLQSRQSRGRMFWGASGVGKTEVAQRVAGLREGFPRLSIGSGEVRYVSGVDGKLEVKEIIDGLPPLSILFLDEADKCLDPKAGMVSAAEATQIRHAIITHFQRKPVLWVFLGVFGQMRTESGITDDSLRNTFGDELAYRVDYADWAFPSWTLENLLKAVNGTSSRRRLRYEDDAALLLAQYCIRIGGGVRAFDNLESAVMRHVRTTGVSVDSIPVSVAREVLAKRGVQVAS